VPSIKNDKKEMEQKMFLRQIAGTKEDLNFFMPYNLFVLNILLLSHV
jgi:hypothetical protein